MASITVNGVTISGSGNIVIDGSNIRVGNNVVSFDAITDSRNINVVINGDVENLSTMSADVIVHGNAGDVESKSGDITVEGEVRGDVESVSGDIDVKGSVCGRVKTVSGDIRHR